MMLAQLCQARVRAHECSINILQVFRQSFDFGSLEFLLKPVAEEHIDESNETSKDCRNQKRKLMRETSR
jgi:hypothetical protein